MKIAIVVHGRFHAFDLAKALIARGHEITLFTNYPKWAVAKFGLRGEIVRSFWFHGVLSRLLYKLSNHNNLWDTARLLSPLFGRWVARQIRGEQYDIVHPFSGIALELLQADHRPAQKYMVVRGSAHIAVQDRLLQQEEVRSNESLERPSAALIAREEREYSMADKVVTLSTFAYDSFVDKGVPKDRIALLPLGVDTKAFRPAPEVLRDRVQRIRAGKRLRVLWV